jgi:hypothetical protein
MPEKAFLPDCEILFNESGELTDEKARERLVKQAKNFLTFLV